MITPILKLVKLTRPILGFKSIRTSKDKKLICWWRKAISCFSILFLSTDQVSINLMVTENLCAVTLLLLNANTYQLKEQCRKRLQRKWWPTSTRRYKEEQGKVLLASKIITIFGDLNRHWYPVKKSREAFDVILNKMLKRLSKLWLLVLEDVIDNCYDKFF